MMAAVLAAASIIGLGILWIGFIIGCHAICEALNSMEEVYENDFY